MTKIPEAFSGLVGWLKPLCRFNKLEDFIICDYKENRLHLKIFTKDHSYSISARLPNSEKLGDGKMISVDGYLGCIAQTRKPRAGENWNRGNDLADGSYSKETFDEIVQDILAYELVKVVKPKHSGTYLDNNGDLKPSNDSNDDLNSVLKHESSMKPYLPTEPKEIEIVKNLLPKQKIGDEIGFRLGRKHYKITRDE